MYTSRLHKTTKGLNDHGCMIPIILILLELPTTKNKRQHRNLKQYGYFKDTKRVNE